MRITQFDMMGLVAAFAVLFFLSDALKAEDDINARDHMGTTPLMVATMSGDTAKMEALIKKGADMDVPDNRGNTALILGAMFGQEEVVELLVRRGASLEKKDNIKGYTAMIAAVRLGYTEVVRILLVGNANRNARDGAGKTALDHAKETKQEDIIRLLQ